MRGVFTFTVSVELEVSDKCLRETQTPDWQKTMYPMTRDEVASMIAYNVARNGLEKLSNLDGFADRDDSELKVISVDWDSDI